MSRPNMALKSVVMVPPMCIRDSAEYVENEIKTMKEVCGDKCLKVIIETCLLTDFQGETSVI